MFITIINNGLNTVNYLQACVFSLVHLYGPEWRHQLVHHTYPNVPHHVVLLRRRLLKVVVFYYHLKNLQN
jgi:hypothetical protein